MVISSLIAAVAVGLGVGFTSASAIAWRRESRELRRLSGAIREIGQGARRIRLPARGGAMRDVQRQLNALIDRFEESRLESLRAQRDRRLMVSHVAHDLRTPLTSALGYLEAAMEDNNLSEWDRRDFLLVVRRKCVLLNDLVDDFFALSSIESSEATPNLEPVDLKASAERVLVAFHRDVIGLGIEPVIRIPEGPLVALAVETQVERVLSNLLSNAIRHGKGATRLYFSITEEAGSLRCGVGDNGSGMDPAELAELMESPYGARGSLGRQCGARGIGLSVVKRLVEGMGGRLEIRAAPGAGIEISFTLARAR